MIGVNIITVTLQEEVMLVQDLFQEKDAYCKNFKLPSRPDYLDYDATRYITMVINEVCNPMISLNNDVRILKSTEFLISEGIDYEKAKLHGSIIANKVFKKICMYFPDMQYEHLANSHMQMVNRFDLMITFTNM